MDIKYAFQIIRKKKKVNGIMKNKTMRYCYWRFGPIIIRLPKFFFMKIEYLFRNIKQKYRRPLVKNFKLKKVFILGWRSGTTLLIRCLTEKSNLKLWGRSAASREPGIRRDIRIYYPHIPIYKLPESNTFNISKCPDFDLIIDLLIEKYNNPKFTILERDVESCVKSFINSNMHIPTFNQIKKNSNLMKDLGNPNNPVDFSYKFCNLMREKRKKFLKNYDKKYILRVDFYEFMGNFDSTMIKICNFVGIKPALEVYRKLRKIKLISTRSNITKYIEM